MSSRSVVTSPLAGGSAESGPRMVTALFPNQGEAESAIKRLLHEGVPQDAIRLMPGNERDRPDRAAAGGRSVDPAMGTGFGAVLGEFFLSENARSLYADGLSQGGCLVAVHATDADHQHVLDILGQEGTIDTDEPDP